MAVPLVSVIIPAFNAENYLEKSVQSVLHQSVSDLEVVIVEDRSTDDTMSVIISLKARDNRVRHLRCPVNSGPGYARNMGIAQSRGEWVTFLDADDWYEPERLERLIAAANKFGLDLAADNQRFIIAESGNCKNLLTSGDNLLVKTLTIEDYFKGDRISRSSRNLGLLKPMIRRELLDRHQIRYDHQKRLSLGEDFYFLLECLKHEKRMIYVTEPLYNYRIDGVLSLTKRLNINSFIEWKNMHQRYISLFDAKSEARELEFMQKRGHEIEVYIHFRRLVEPLKHGHYRDFFREVCRDPKRALILLVRDTAKDPSAITLLLRYSTLNITQKISRLFTKHMKLTNTKHIRFDVDDLDEISDNEKR